MRRLLKVLLCTALAVLAAAVGACGGMHFGLVIQPRYYLDGLPFNAALYDGYWHQGYVYYDGLWYYHGIGTPYEWYWYD